VGRKVAGTAHLFPAGAVRALAARFLVLVQLNGGRRFGLVVAHGGVVELVGLFFFLSCFRKKTSKAECPLFF
jgi:hypothetical protein